MADIVVIIPCFNVAPVLERQLAALDAQTDLGFRVLICDNGSTDDTIRVAQDWKPKHHGVDVVNAAGMQGVAHARNVGIASSDEPIVLICDGDDAVFPSWVAGMRAGLSTAQVVSGPLELVFPDDPSRSETWNSNSLPTSMGFLRYAPGANMGFRREVFDQIGTFDECLSTGQEDVDLGWRAALAGLRMHHSPDAAVHYYQRSGLNALLRQQWRYGRAHAQLYAKHRLLPDIPAPASNKTSMRWFIEWGKQLPTAWRQGRCRSALGAAVFQLSRWLEALRVGACPL